MGNEEKTAKLRSMLQTAIELEFSTIPPYLVALLSIQPHANREAANLIRGVMIEEMLHMALVANVFNAVGGEPRIGRNHMPSYPLELNFEGKKFRDRQFPVNLARFSKDNIQTFMEIEEPQDIAQMRPEAFVEVDIEGLTIGEFYMNIIGLLEELNDGGALFTGDPERQLIDDYYWAGGGHIIPVTDLASATAALETVIRQGEGAWRPPGKHVVLTPHQPLQMGHYYRFAEIYYERHYTEDDDPTQPPTGTPLPVDWSAAYPIRENPKSSDYAPGSKLATLNNTFNARYTEMLRQLEQAFNGVPRTLYTAIMNGMHTLPPLGSQMMTIPIDGSGETGCPTFDWLPVP